MAIFRGNSPWVGSYAQKLSESASIPVLHAIRRGYTLTRVKVFSRSSDKLIIAKAVSSAEVIRALEAEIRRTKKPGMGYTTERDFVKICFNGLTTAIGQYLRAYREQKLRIGWRDLADKILCTGMNRFIESFPVFLILLLNAFPAHGMIYGSNSGGSDILEWPNATFGNTIPTTTVRGVATTMVRPNGIAVDDNWIYVTDVDRSTNNLHVKIFSKSATGNAAPAHSFMATTDLNNFGVGGSIAIDSNWIYTTSTRQITPPGNNYININVFPINGSGALAHTLQVPLVGYIYYADALAGTYVAVGVAGTILTSPDSTFVPVYQRSASKHNPTLSACLFDEFFQNFKYLPS